MDIVATKAYTKVINANSKAKTRKATRQLNPITNYIDYKPIQPQRYSKKQRLGIILEQWVVRVLMFLFPISRGYRIKHVDWKDYTNNSAPKKISVDIRLFLRNKLIAVFECKNWRLLPDHRYGITNAYNETLSRFHNAGTYIRILAISFKNQLAKTAINLLLSLIHI